MYIGIDGAGITYMEKGSKLELRGPGDILYAFKIISLSFTSSICIDSYNLVHYYSVTLQWERLLLMIQYYYAPIIISLSFMSSIYAHALLFL